jgi:inosine/xanthosine triphosphatase
MKVLVGSENPVKIQSVKEGFLTFFEHVEVKGVNVDTGVPHQPMNDETFEGAKNRAENVKRMNDQQNLDATFFVGIEGGVLQLQDRWFSVNVVYILDQHNRDSFATTGLYELPSALSKDLLIEKDLGHAMAALADDNFAARERGTVAFLTDGKIDRFQNQVQGVILALIPFVNDNLYFSCP